MNGIGHLRSLHVICCLRGLPGQLCHVKHRGACGWTVSRQPPIFLSTLSLRIPICGHWFLHFRRAVKVQ